MYIAIALLLLAAGAKLLAGCFRHANKQCFANDAKVMYCSILYLKEFYL
jgi:hypothetical protein